MSNGSTKQKLNLTLAKDQMTRFPTLRLATPPKYRMESRSRCARSCPARSSENMDCAVFATARPNKADSNKVTGRKYGHGFPLVRFGKHPEKTGRGGNFGPVSPSVLA